FSAISVLQCEYEREEEKNTPPTYSGYFTVILAYFWGHSIYAAAWAGPIGVYDACFTWNWGD
ncbi:MAG: hypothetical protein KAG66_23320, partial [Methylococcales bacterium]|nr:hypothetical protein [Methylococcales bacterium]